jgi:hypothetical protein
MTLYFIILSNRFANGQNILDDEVAFSVIVFVWGENE